MLGRLGKLESEFAQKLLFAIKCRIIDRRQKTVSTLIAYLENPSFLDSVTGLQLAYSDHEEIVKKGFHVKDLSKYLKYLPATLDCTSSLHTHHQSKCQTNKKDLLA